uniref:C2H2-type domain-containing protein n=1 Tax=Callorhinchus milii TaxID=7868 RepID=A0A4W3HJI1_CALMI
MSLPAFVHAGDKPYECGACTKRFGKSGDLARHRLTHSGEKPFSCEACAKRFGKSSDLLRHQRTHSGERPGERPYQCDVCQKRFGAAGALSKSFPCDVCCSLDEMLDITPCPCPIQARC